MQPKLVGIYSPEGVVKHRRFDVSGQLRIPGAAYFGGCLDNTAGATGNNVTIYDGVDNTGDLIDFQQVGMGTIFAVRAFARGVICSRDIYVQLSGVLRFTLFYQDLAVDEVVQGQL